MLNRKRKRIFVAVAVALLLGLLIVLLSTSSAKADGPPSPEVPVVTDPAVTDPCFRQDPECYNPEVECAENIFVPLNPDGTWTCPPRHDAEPDPDDPRLGEQLPSEVIGRQVDCPDGSVGYIIDIDLNTNCEEVPGEYPVLSETTPPATASEVSDIRRINPFQYGLVAVGLVLTAAGALYMIFKKQN